MFYQLLRVQHSVLPHTPGVVYYLSRVGKSACPRVLDAQKMAVDDQKISFGRPPDDQN